ncbi:MAG: group 1 glycosyl transferase [Flavobacteriales bacterium]|nr:group 1 glycosyl transferase [Flavobacteriales bacterium]|tara:strand:- start:1431 stop:2558 length:1128 start_codon:yes stop_codon:yes gene_type:complete
MKIGFDAKRLFNNFTGLGNYSRSLLKDLSGLTASNQLYLYSPSIKENSTTSPFFDDQNYVLKSSEKLFWRSKGVVKDLKRDGIDLYHGLSNEIPFGIPHSGVKSIVTIHDLIFKIYPNTYRYIDSKIYDFKFKYACRNADRIIAISESTKADIIRFYDVPSQKIEVIYQACDPLYYHLQTKDQIDVVLKRCNVPSRFMLYVGSVIERKNLLTILKAQERLDAKLRIPLVIVGKGDTYQKRVEHYIKVNRLENHVLWLSNISDNLDLQALYQAADIFIYPSVYEGFGIPVVEALLSKTPVITSNCSSLPEAAGPNSICIDPNNVDAMARAMTDIFTNETLRESMIREGFIYAQDKFNGMSNANKVMNLYQNVFKHL